MKWIESSSEILCDRGADNIVFSEGRYKFDLWGGKFDSVFNPETVGYKFFEHVLFVIEDYDYQVKEVTVDTDLVVAKGFIPFEKNLTPAMTATFCSCGSISKRFEEDPRNNSDTPHAKDCPKSA